MDGGLTNALSVWNASRTTASAAISVANSDLSYGEAEADCLIWPFRSESDLNSIVDQTLSSEGDTDELESDDETTYTGSTDKLQRVVYEEVKENLEAIGAFETYDNSAVISDWNTAALAATHLYNWVLTTDHTVVEDARSLVAEPADPVEAEFDSYNEVAEQHPEYAPEDPRALCCLLEALPVESDTYRDHHTCFTRVLYNHETPYADTVEFDVESFDDKSEIADDLITVFGDHAGIGYSEVKQKYSVELPARDAAMMAVTRATGASRSERRGELVEWVSGWYGNTDEVAEINSGRPKPMGL